MVRIDKHQILEVFGPGGAGEVPGSTSKWATKSWT